ncbi:hypothetical protein [Synechococcus sp. PCC 6312]|uniref:hypothetical protein n=1 Tax=Synechococcus sp. (strain ATCC 27167 / PCC 6312) TaxID=195253 RepID=UPI00029F0DA3|nr:hypothetical protein [Synechococcus sp. PCC 6312]AFY61893.1 hypothetical protein Syn6312_2817 [Synechococcus sp. PCC 6312]
MVKQYDLWLWQRLSQLAKAEGGIESEARKLRNMIGSGKYCEEDRERAIEYVKSHDSE